MKDESSFDIDNKTNPVQTVAPTNKEDNDMLRATEKITALYCRLSVEDTKEDKKNGKEDELEKEKAVVICVCNNITDQDMEEFIKNGGKSFEEFQEKTKIATVCGGCKEKAMELFEDYMHLFGG